MYIMDGFRNVLNKVKSKDHLKRHFVFHKHLDHSIVPSDQKISLSSRTPSIFHPFSNVCFVCAWVFFFLMHQRVVCTLSDSTASRVLGSPQIYWAIISAGLSLRLPRSGLATFDLQ